MNYGPEDRFTVHKYFGGAKCVDGGSFHRTKLSPTQLYMCQKCYKTYLERWYE